MKKLILLALACAPAAFPASILCGLTGTLAGGTGSGSISCPGLDAGAGNKLVNLFLLEGADANTVLSTTNGVATVLFTFGASPYGIFAGGPTYTISGSTVGGGLSSSPTSPQNTPTFNFGVNTQTAATFSVTYNSQVTSGSVSSSSGLIILNYDTMAVGTATPEPATLGLLGSALLGLGLLKFRKS